MLIRQGGRAESEEYIRYIICKEFCWDYYTFESQPPFFIEQIIIFMNQESEKGKREVDRMNRQTQKTRIPKPMKGGIRV